MYKKGRGVPQNYGEALKWFKVSAEKGFALGQYNLGVMYEKGQGVSQNYKDAFKWYQLSAEQGYGIAQRTLGFLYEAGKIDSKNYVLAYMWFSLASIEGDEDAAKDKNRVEQKMTVAQIKKANEMVVSRNQKINKPSQPKPCTHQPSF